MTSYGGLHECTVDCGNRESRRAAEPRRDSAVLSSGSAALRETKLNPGTNEAPLPNTGAGLVYVHRAGLRGIALVHHVGAHQAVQGRVDLARLALLLAQEVD